MRKLTDDERIEPNESMSESDESIYHIKEINNIVEHQKHYTAKVKINGTQRAFIIDTGSPVTIMPLDERIMKKTKIQKITKRSQDVNKNEIKFRGKIPVDMEYENSKQKLEILITERTDIRKRTIKDTEINIQLKPGHYPVKQKARPIPLHLQKNVGRELEKPIKAGHLE